MAETIKSLADLLRDPFTLRLVLVCIIAVLIFWIISALIGGMPMPTPQSTARYRYWFKVLNIVAANVKRAARVAHIPFDDSTQGPQEPGGDD